MTQRVERVREHFGHWLLIRFARLRAVLLALGGVHVALWVLIGSNVAVGLFLFLAQQNLFVSPVGADEIKNPIARATWNAFVSSSDITLLALAVCLWMGVRFCKSKVVWWASAISTGIWGAIWAFAWAAYYAGFARFATIHFSAILPIAISIFVCLRISADSSDLELNCDDSSRSRDV